MKFTDGFDGAFVDGFVDLAADCRSSSICSCFDSVHCIDHLLLFFLIVIILVFFRANGAGGGSRGCGCGSGGSSGSSREGSCFCFEKGSAVDSV